MPSLALHPPVADVAPTATITRDGRLVVTIEVDGRDLQAVTEWHKKKPTGVQAWKTPMGWMTTRLYDPFTREWYDPYPSPSSASPRSVQEN